MKKDVIASMIDHTILKPEASKKKVQKICEEAVENNFASVCINPCNVTMCAVLLKGSNIKVCTVIGFPLGATTSCVKGFEALDAVKNGADEVDMVINIGRLKDKDYDYVREDIRAVVDAVRGKALVKVIIETCLLTDDEKISACKIAKEEGADFVKTSTGFSIGGASIADIRLMRKTIGSVMGIKAAGGIHSYDDAARLVEAGASRIGASASIAICEGAEI
jgi:deoxyribose-phosphate aldolase